MNNTLFFHGKTLDGKRFTIAGKFESKNGLLKKKVVLNLGLAMCSKNDLFVKKVGRVKAEGRLKSNSGKLTLLVKNKFTDKTASGTFINLVKDYSLLKSKKLQKKFNLYGFNFI